MRFNLTYPLLSLLLLKSDRSERHFLFENDPIVQRSVYVDHLHSVVSESPGALEPFHCASTKLYMKISPPDYHRLSLGTDPRPPENGESS